MTGHLHIGEQAAGLSDVQIAEHCRVSHDLVRLVRDELATYDERKLSTTPRKGKDNKVRVTSSGKRRAEVRDFIGVTYDHVKQTIREIVQNTPAAQGHGGNRRQVTNHDLKERKSEREQRIARLKRDFPEIATHFRSAGSVHVTASGARREFSRQFGGPASASFTHQQEE